jgi:hypothetical protein
VTILRPAIACFFVAVSLFGQANVNGPWTGAMVEDRFGVRSVFSVTFAQTGANLSGSITGGSNLASSQSSPLSGTLGGADIFFQATSFLGDPNILQTFNGSVASGRITGTWQIPLSNAGPGNSGTFELDRQGPTPPSITSLDPSTRGAGGPAFILTVIGTNLTRNTVVQWNGADRSTTWISSSEVIASIQSQDVAGPGTAQITVQDNQVELDDQVHGLVSNALPFQISNSIFGMNLIGSMPHIAAAENWTTSFTLVNSSLFSAQARLSLFDDGGMPLPVQFTFPQSGSGALLASSLDRTIIPSASLVINGGGPASVPVQVGSAQLAATGTVGGFAIFHLIPTGQEAVVPIETRNASSYVLAFDNTNGAALGVALTNVAAAAGNVNVTVRDDKGIQIGTDSIPLPGGGHTSFVMAARYPVTAGKRGTIEFFTPAGGQISALGIRSTPPGTLTTIPVLANIGNSGGSAAHIAVANHWKTTIVLVNTGGSSAQAHVRFYDDNGSPLTLPLTFPQGGNGISGSAVDRTLAANATLVMESTGPDTTPVQVGSMQLTTDGKVSGFVIFHHSNGQEAVVLLENRAANAYLLAFDNTGGVVTGVAVNNASTQAATVPVIIRDESGAQIGTGSIGLAANGHSAFVMSTQFPVTANIRGTLEFGTPAGGQIGVVGIRTTPKPAFTTLPPLAK